MTSNESIFVIGFPKSGTTWLTRLVAECLQAPRAGGMPPGKPRRNKPATRMSTTLEPPPGGGLCVRKTHLTPANLQTYMGSKAEKGLYVYRDLRDVLVSGFMSLHTIDHEVLLARRDARLPRDTPSTPLSLFKRLYWRRESRRQFREFVNRICSCGWKPFGGWTEHVSLWRDYAAADSNRRIAFVSYEELSKDTPGVLGRALDALGVAVTVPDGLAAVVERNSAQRLLEVPVAQPPPHRQGSSRRVLRHGTLRKAAIGDHRNYMTRREARIVERTHGVMLRELGYVNGPDWIDTL